MNKKGFNRRIFLKASLMGTTGTVLGHNIPVSESVSSFKPDKKVIRRKLGNTSIELPVVSFGVMRADNPNLVRAAMEAGVEHFDTAHGYQHGNNEKMLGEVLKEYPRKTFTLATKVQSREKEAFMEEFNSSLERLKMDYVDILYAHSLSSREDVLAEPLLDALQTVKKQGKARFIGLSTHSKEPEVIKAAIESKVYEVILTAYNFKQDHKDKITKCIEEASRAGIGIVAMKTMAGGRLGKEAEKMHYLAALKWALKNPHVHTSIPGITTFKELEENMSVMENLDLTTEEENFLSAATLQQGLYCNGCRKCVNGCRKNLPIPDMMRAYMYAYGYGEMNKAKQELTALGIGDNPCANCTGCTVSCVKGFNIPQKMADISRLTKVPDDFLT